MRAGCTTRPGVGSRVGSAVGHRTIGRAIGIALAGLLAACSGANREGTQPDTTDELGQTEAAGKSGSTAESPEEAAALGPINKGSFREHPGKFAWVFDDDATKPSKLEIGKAEAAGYTVIDLSNTWTPYIFTEKTPGVEDQTENRYRKTFIGLANDEIDSDGDKLSSWEHNFLELYGIPPSLRVIKDEWDRIETEVQPCLDAANYDGSVFAGFTGTITYKRSTKGKRNRSARWFKSKLDDAMRKAKIAGDYEAAKDNPKTRTLYRQWREIQQPIDIVAHAQKRFRCEGLFTGRKGEGNFDPGIFDAPTTHALARFERKHDIMGWGHFKPDNVAMLAKSQQEAVHARLLRALTERVVASAGIIEDGSAKQWKKGKFRWKDKNGKEHELRDLVGEFSTAAFEALGVQTPESARERMAMLSDLGDGNFDNLLVAVKLPPLPEYYAENMQFQTVIDRGDVWYDFPYTEDGRRLGQPRGIFPHITVYVNYNDQRIPLMHWRTTIGSWRKEVNEGEVQMKYKNSDVGDRVWRDIVAAPVWIPPASTPPAELIKGRYKNGKFHRGVNYDEIGPGYRSAYGLVAAYHVRETLDETGAVVKTFDNSIRTHGSVDYMSILGRYSHGCHRLYNMDAVRLFSFVLRHRDYERKGRIPVGVGRYITVEDKTYHMKIGSRGYEYQLLEPIPVTVTSGRIRGRRRSPHTEYLPIPTKPGEETVEGEPVDVIEVPEAG
jgi:hypothetical protein